MAIDDAHKADKNMHADACEYLAEMILELQQMALRLGIPGAASHLQAAYLETCALAKTMNRPGN